MSQTKWPLSSLPILKLDDLGAKQACEVFYTTQYEMLWGLPTVGFLFSVMPVLAYILSNNQRRMSIQLYLLYLGLGQSNIMEQSWTVMLTKNLRLREAVWHFSPRDLGGQNICTWLPTVFQREVHSSFTSESCNTYLTDCLHGPGTWVNNHSVTYWSLWSNTTNLRSHIFVYHFLERQHTVHSLDMWITQWMPGSGCQVMKLSAANARQTWDWFRFPPFFANPLTCQSLSFPFCNKGARTLLWVCALERKAESRKKSFV